MQSRSTSVDKPTRRKLNALGASMAVLEKKYTRMMLALQAQCKHPADQIVEAPYRDGYLSTEPPFRVCKQCGLAEEGWHCGYWKLATQKEVASVSRETAHRDYVLKFYSQEEMSKRRFK